ncbi:hypothetical protein LWC34_03320 [Kibdelosporangium philippinense]|uniref:ABC transporter permease n=1 Tax=Kibdelosporangium philippinense TaxID=211113 RepID=A0ABS8Z537_9PSEU|nr:hypothetical protein [Kibdelosporangium philippinense]MCE7001870.1 hypothetical protein [Kibdelosporangium philippinense]
MRALRIELRRSAALWTGLLILLISLAYFYLLQGPWSWGTDAWTAEWTALAMWQRFTLHLTWPFALAAGAWQGRRNRRATMDELLSTMPKQALTRAAPPTLAMCVGVTGAYLAFFVLGAVQVFVNSSYMDISWVPVTLVGILSLNAAVLVGMGIGRLLPSLLTAPILGVLGILAMAFGIVGGPETEGSVLQGMVSHQYTLLVPAFGDQPDIFTQLSTRVNLLQGLWFLALATTGFGLLALISTKARLLALLPAVAALAIVYPLLPSSSVDTFTLNSSAAALQCEDRLCITKMHEHRRAEIEGPFREALTQLTKLPDAPTTVEEAPVRLIHMSSLPQRPGVVYFHFDDPAFHRNSKRAVLAGSQPMRCGDLERAAMSQAKRVVVASWFDGELAPTVLTNMSYPNGEAIAKRVWDDLHALPADQQPARVAELRASAQEC